MSVAPAAEMVKRGKAMRNRSSVSAPAGPQEIMLLGGLNQNRNRVFWISLTHGAERLGLAAAQEAMRVYGHEPVVMTIWSRGESLPV